VSVWVAGLLEDRIEGVDRGFDGDGLVDDRNIPGVSFRRLDQLLEQGRWMWRRECSTLPRVPGCGGDALSK